MNRPNGILRLVVVAAAALLALASAIPARADDPIPTIPPVPTGQPTPSPSPTETAKPKPKPKPNPPKPRPQPPKTNPTVTQPKGPAPDVFQGPIADALAYWRSLPKSPARTTTVLLELLARLQPPTVPLDDQAVARGVGRFPIAGYVWYQDDWAAPRYLPYFHMHEGNDLFAQAGTPVVAAADGVIEKLMVGSIGGVSIWLRDDAGTVYYYGHLRNYAPSLTQGMRVTVGTPIATVGDTGVAKGTYPHVHFEVHPGGGLPINPKPILDSWLTQAEDRARAAIIRNGSATSAAKIGAARWRSLFGLLSQQPAFASTTWASAPASSASGFVDLALDRLAIEIDWDAYAQRMVSQIGEGAHDDATNPVVDDHGLLAGSLSGHDDASAR